VGLKLVHAGHFCFKNSSICSHGKSSYDANLSWTRSPRCSDGKLGRRKTSLARLNSGSVGRLTSLEDISVCIRAHWKCRGSLVLRSPLAVLVFGAGLKFLEAREGVCSVTRLYGCMGNAPICDWTPPRQSASSSCSQDSGQKTREWNQPR
jgi:hypothetical protein